MGLEDVTADDVTELLEAHDQPLSNEDLEELYKELDREQSEKEENEEETPRIMKMANLKCILSAMESLTDELCELNNDWNKVQMQKGASSHPFNHIPKFLMKENKNLNN